MTSGLETQAGVGTCDDDDLVREGRFWIREVGKELFTADAEKLEEKGHG